MYKVVVLILCGVFSSVVSAESTGDKKGIERAVRDYIEAQHNVEPSIMARSLDKKLAKRTYWQSKDGTEFVMETSFDTMIRVAETYNKNGDSFPEKPRVEIEILDHDYRVASVKLTTDDWIDYMHLYKNDKEEWKVLNVLWQYHDSKRHISKK